MGRGLTRVTLGLHREAVADATRAIRLGEPTDKRLYNAPGFYARAAVAAAADVKKTGQDAVDLVSRYQDQAVVLSAPGRDAASGRAALDFRARAWFWSNPALNP